MRSLRRQFLKKQNPKADVADLEKKIDNIVYELYNLSEEEIKIVENNKHNDFI